MKNIMDSIELDNEKIDLVYNGLKNEWVNDIDKSEFDFIKNQMSSIFSKNDVYDKDVVNLEYNNKLKLHEYLQRKLDWVGWTDNDHYNDYLKTKKFDNPILHEYNHRQFESINRILNDYKRRYDYIFNKLSTESKIEFKNDWIDHLEKLKKLQTESKYKEIINDLISSIKQHECETNLTTTQYPINETHADIFSNNGFELFEYLLTNYVVTGRGRISDISYFYWKMYNDTTKFIHQRPECFKGWFRKTYPEDVELSKIKTLIQLETAYRKKHFSDALDWFKQREQ